MRTRTPVGLALAAALVATAFAAVQHAAPADAATAAGTNISNAANATYSDGSGGNFAVNSNTVTIVVQNVAIGAASNVTTGQNVAPYQTVTDRFLLTNAGNNAGKFQLTALPLPTAQSGTAAVPISVVLTPQGGSATTIAYTGNATTDLAAVNTALNGLNIPAGNTLAVDVKYGTGSFVVQSAQIDQTTVSATLTYAGGTGYVAQTSAASSVAQNDNVQEDVSWDLEMREVTPTTSGQNIKYDVLGANSGAYAAQPVALSSIGLPGTGVIPVIDRVPTFNGNPLALKTVPTLTVTAANGYAGTAATMYYTTAAAPFTSGTAWTAITGGTTVGQLAFATYLAVVVTGPSSLAGKGASFSDTANVPNAAIDLHLEIAQPTGAGSSLPGAVKNMANSIVGSNATDASGTLAPLLTGPNSTSSFDNTAINAADINGMVQNTLAVGDSGASGTGYSNRTAGNAVSGSVNVGPVGFPSATGAFSYATGPAAFFDSGAADNNHDYTAIGVYTGLTGGAIGQAPVFYTTPASPAVIVIPNTVLNNGNIADTFVITSAPIGPTTGWTVAYAANAACTGATAAFTTASVAVAGSSTFYACYTPPASAQLAIFAPYGYQLNATSASDPSATNATFNLISPGGVVGLFKDGATSGTPTQGTLPCATTPAPGCTVVYTITYMNGNPRSGANNLFGGASIATAGGTQVSAGVSGYQIFDDGVNGANQNAATGLKNNWGNLTLTSGLTAAPVDSSAKCTFYYLYDGSVLTASNGSLTVPTAGTPATAFRCAYGSNTLLPDLLQTITFSVVVK
jgi:hypothetical protein